MSLQEAAENIVRIASSLGAEETTARVSRGSWTELQRRDGQVEKAQESRSLSAGISLMVDGRYSAHSTSDLRPAALKTFIENAVAATRFLEPDLDRRLPDLNEMGETEAPLDTVDLGHAARGPDERRSQVEEIEATCTAAAGELPTRSITAFGWDGSTESALTTSHGFRSVWESTSFGAGAMVSLEDKGGRLPEAWTSFQTRHFADLPTASTVAQDLTNRGRQRLGSGPIESGRYPCLLDRRVTGGLLRVLMGPLGGTAIFEGRSCLKERLNTKIGSQQLTIIDDPLIPRALGSHPHDGDGLPAQRRVIVDEGTLRMFFLGVYNARRLSMTPTTAGSSNLVIPPGSKSPTELAQDHERVIRIDGFLGGNTNPTTGNFSFGVQGTLLENGQPARALSEMNVSGNLFDLLERYIAPANDVWTYGSWRAPSLFFDDLQFAGA